MTPPAASEGSVLAVEAPIDNDDIFGPSRSYPPENDRPKPSMISAELRAKEERKRVIRICTEKLEKIKDPDRNLRRSVCINNTYFKLQDEVRREKRMKRASINASYEETINQERRSSSAAERRKRTLDSALQSIDEELNAIGADAPPPERDLLDDLTIPLPDPLRLGETGFASRAPSPMPLSSDDGILDPLRRSRKRSFDEVSDCDVHEVLSQFYMPPTPSLISAIDDDLPDEKPQPSPAPTPHQEESSRKKVKLDDRSDFVGGFDKLLELDAEIERSDSGFRPVEVPTPCPEPPKKIRICRPGKSEFEYILDALRLDDSDEARDRGDLMYFCRDTECDVRSRYSPGPVSPSMDTCGQAAILGDQQAASFHGLLASLET